MSLRNPIAAILWTSVALCQTSTTTTSTGKISGTIQTLEGKAVPSISVAIRVRPTKLGATYQAFSTNVSTGSDGTFVVTAVPAGNYAICPVAPSSLLAPCTWDVEPTAIVATGQAVTVPAIKLKPSADLYVRVNDANGVLAAVQGIVPGSSLMLAVRTPLGRVLPVPRTAADSLGADHHLPVPHATNLKLFSSSSKNFSMTFGGAPVDSQLGLSVNFNIPTGQAQLQQTISLH